MKNKIINEASENDVKDQTVRFANLDHYIEKLKGSEINLTLLLTEYTGWTTQWLTDTTISHRIRIEKISYFINIELRDLGNMSIRWIRSMRVRKIGPNVHVHIKLNLTD